MLNRIAVIIAGEYRTWDSCAKYFFRAFQGRANQIDYFFVTWDKSPDPAHSPKIDSFLVDITDDDVKKHFNDNHRLVDYKIIPTDSISIAHTYYLKAYLSKMGNVLKRQKEITEDFVYDQVIDTRPDIYFRAIEKLPFYSLRDFDLRTVDETGITGNAFFLDDRSYASIVDVYQRTTSLTHDIICSRTLDTRPVINKRMQSTVLNHHTHHQLFATHLSTHNIVAEFSNEFDFYKPIRKAVPVDVDLDQLSIEEIHELMVQVDNANT